MTQRLAIDSDYSHTAILLRGAAKHGARLVIGLCTCVLSSDHAAAAKFYSVGDLSGALTIESTASAISDDGKVLVGMIIGPFSTRGAFRWTMSGGIEHLGYLPGFETVASYAADVTPDGSIVVGGSGDLLGSLGEPFIWDSENGMRGLGGLPTNARHQGRAWAVSGDGTAVVGAAASIPEGIFPRSEAFRWTAQTGMTGLDDLPGGSRHSSATDVTRDGKVVVGHGHDGLGTAAWRWSEERQFEALGDLPGGDSASSARAISAFGDAIVGASSSSNGNEAFIWRENRGMEGLGDLPGGEFSSSALAVSADGQIVVGVSESSSGQEAFIWREETGMKSLRSVLSGENGLSQRLLGWTLDSANAISPDGRFIAGTGLNPNNHLEAWVAMIPEPSGLTQMATIIACHLGFLLLCRR